MVESGWDGVLEEAKDAGIPVILTDRAVDSEDTSLYMTFIGSDFVEEGERVGEWVSENFAEPSNVVELAGHHRLRPGERPQVAASQTPSRPTRTSSHRLADRRLHPADGKKVMEGFLQAHTRHRPVFAHNDDMGLGAIEAIEAAGMVPGKDIKIVTIDAVHDGMQALADGKINYIVECNPLLGPQLMDIAKTVLDGEDGAGPDRHRRRHVQPGAGDGVLPDRQY